MSIFNLWTGWNDWKRQVWTPIFDWVDGKGTWPLPSWLGSLLQIGVLRARRGLRGVGLAWKVRIFGCWGRIGLFKGYSLSSGNCVAPPGGGGVGGNTPYNGLNGEGPPARGIFFRLHGIWKGRDFTSSWWKGRKIFHFGRKKAKRTNRYILWLWKSRENVLALWYINISKTVDLQQLKGMPSSKLSTLFLFL